MLAQKLILKVHSRPYDIFSFHVLNPKYVKITTKKHKIPIICLKLYIFIFIVIDRLHIHKVVYKLIILTQNKCKDYLA